MLPRPAPPACHPGGRAGCPGARGQAYGHAPARSGLGGETGRNPAGRRTGRHCARYGSDQRSARRRQPRGGRDLTAKRLANIRSELPGGRKGQRLDAGQSQIRGKPVLSSAWVDLFARLSGRRAHIGLSRLARFASARGLAPKEINDEVIADLIAAVREQSLCPRPTVLHRQVTQIWNEAARDPALGLRPVTVPSYRSPKRIDWALLPKAFRRDSG